MMTMDIFERISLWCSEQGLWELDEVDKVGVALSGGPDSVFLLEFLLNVKHELNREIFVVHLNHNLRGAAAEENESFVRALAAKYNLRSHVESVDIKKLANDKELSLETAAREARYDFFKRLAEQENALIATGHTADDNVETILFNLIRGAGLEGVKGIPAKRSFVIRPILTIYKEEIVDYLKRNNIEYRVDRTNLETKFTRNKIRHKLIPLIEEELNPSVKRNIMKFSDIIRTELKFVKRIVADELRKLETFSWGNGIALNIELFDLEFGVFGELVKSLFARFGLDMNEFNYHRIDEFYYNFRQSKPGAEFVLNRGDRKFIVEKRDSRLICFVENNEEKREKIVVRPDCELELGDSIFDFKFISDLKGETFPPNNDLTVFLKVDSANKISLEFPKPGDRFVPLGMSDGKHKKVARYYIDKKVPRFLRERLLLLYVNDYVVWLPGLAISEKFKINESDKHILKCQLKGKLAQLIRGLVYE